MTAAAGCPFLAQSRNRGATIGWALSSAMAAAALSGLAALAMTAEVAGESMGQEDVAVVMLAARPELSAMSEPAPDVAPDTPDLPDAQPDEENPVSPPKADDLPDPMTKAAAAPEAPPTESAPSIDRTPIPPPKLLAESDVAPAEPKAEVKPKPKPKVTTKPKDPPTDAPEKPAPTKKTAAKDKPKAAPSEPSAEASAASKKQAASASAGNGAKAVANYGASVMKKIRKVRKAKAPGRGTVVVGFMIAADGNLASVKVLRSSGSADLDQVAVDHIRRAAPFQPPPEGAERRFSFEFVGKQ